MDRHYRPTNLTHPPPWHAPSPSRPWCGDRSHRQGESPTGTSRDPSSRGTLAGAAAVAVAGARRSVEDGPTRSGLSRGGHLSTPAAPPPRSRAALACRSPSPSLCCMLGSAWWGRARGGSARGRVAEAGRPRQLKLGEGTTRRPRRGSDTRASPPGGPP